MTITEEIIVSLIHDIVAELTSVTANLQKIAHVINYKEDYNEEDEPF